MSSLVFYFSLRFKKLTPKSASTFYYLQIEIPTYFGSLRTDILLFLLETFYDDESYTLLLSKSNVFVHVIL